jgi:lactoylglutathione lyase
MIKRVEHVGIIVSDMDESIKFYEDMLNFKVRVRVMTGDKELTFLTHQGLPEFEIELIRDVQVTTNYSKNGLVNHLAFVIENMEKTINDCRKKGIIFLSSEPKQGINGRQTIRFKGPNGEILQFVEERK